MKVILLVTIKKLGKSGQLIHVKNGYARNYLIPKEKVILATNKNIKKFENSILNLEKQQNEKILEANVRIKKIQSIKSIIIYKKSSEKKKIFGSVGVSDIIKSLALQGIFVKKQEIKLPNGLLRYLGEHTVIFSPYKGICTNISISIINSNS
ncbi:50S ribosomal protein L9 [Buchnera aphidicola (Cinara tujafilina)]|uniref:Large ribosomal subunit protein bL9 n=1 Tax=Buchnera aphidicola (Cinara tujafilina) TaxID=261317 RepID=F7WZR2_9GAMM|nr:50S ribosomal protein L9 [Buchnera aphidicola]AEH39938.1 50S ribosomal protein L9 [Buchnera aphidicola (Cinara tujafilina)]